MCPVPRNKYTEAVSIVTSSVENPKNFIWLTDFKKSSSSEFTVCLHSAFVFKTDKPSAIVEWNELNKLMGGDTFIIYSYSSSLINNEVLKLYQKRGLVNVIQ